MDLKTDWNVFSKNRDAVYGADIISILIFHFFEDVYLRKSAFDIYNYKTAKDDDSCNVMF